MLGPDDASFAAIRTAAGWDHLDLYNSVSETLLALPAYFKSELRITGVLATDLYTFNTALGATIENQIVDSLNERREDWDPNDDYRDYRFVRQAQRFPDVILRGSTPAKTDDIILGIELKGWYALAKEREPSFRFVASPNVVAPWDILAVYPWALSEVTSGTPSLFTPWVASARWAAEYRNWYWQHGMRSKGDKTITLATHTSFYPPSKSEMNDVPASDTGNNFGRLGRYGIMDEYMESLRKELVSGIPVDAWQRFLKIFSEARDESDVTRDLARLLGEYELRVPGISAEDVEDLKEHLTQAVGILDRAK
jgi:hypothetical protein